MKRTAIITGASGNLGSAVVQKFLKGKFQIAAIETPRSTDKIQESPAIRSFPVDLVSEHEVADVVEDICKAFGRIDIAILTVGGFAMGDLAGTVLRDLDNMFRLNFLTAFNIARQLFVRMSEQEGGGQLVFIGSRSAIHPEEAKGLVAYSLTKSLIFRLAEVINADGRDKHIRATVVIPSTIDTPLNRVAMPNVDYSKWVSPAEIAENIFNLVTPAGEKLRESVIKIYGDS